MSGSGFVTKDSGERQTFSTGMVRDTGAKELRPDLLSKDMLTRWLQVEEEFDLDKTIMEATRAAKRSFNAWFADAEDDRDAAAHVHVLIDHIERMRGRGAMRIRLAELMGRGAIKYGERNWEKARTPEELERFKASAARHFAQWEFGMNPEEDHAAAVLFNVGGAEYVKARIAAEKQPKKHVVTGVTPTSITMVEAPDNFEPGDLIELVPPLPARIVKAGDELVQSGANAVHTITEFDLPFLSTWKEVGWTHADGAPIDPTQPGKPEPAALPLPWADWPSDHVGPV